MLGWSHLLQEHICKGEAGSAGQGKANQLAVVRAQLREDVMTSICTGVIGLSTGQGQVPVLLWALSNEMAR